MEFVVPCLFGLEGIAANELRRMDIKEVRAENGRVRFSGGWTEMVRANLRLRTGERVLLSLGSFRAGTFDELFEGVKKLSLADYIPRNGTFPVKGYCLNSKLHSVPDCQKIIKKASADNLGRHYRANWMPEDGPLYQIQFSVISDVAEIYLDTSGEPLFKRGYRPAHVTAPLRETLAAGMVSVAHYRGKEVLCDPLCGSGTIAIEAALLAHNIAPGIHRSFAAEKWVNVPENLWSQERENARGREYPGPYSIFASDCDPKAVAISRENAKRAGVEKDITFAVSDATKLELPSSSGILITNPPYGERMLEKEEAENLYKALGQKWKNLEDWEKYIITSHPEFESVFGKKASKKRKLYNGMILCYLYMYLQNEEKTGEK